MTGYTHELVEKKLDFPAFALSCARAFGALIEMREDPNDAPIPEELPVSDYHAKAAVEARATFAKMSTMTEAERLAWAERKKVEDIDHHRTAMEKTAINVRIMRDMLAQVDRWTPPTPEHENMKSFMIQQLTESVKWEEGSSYYDDAVTRLQATSPLDLFNEALASAEKDIAYHDEHYAEDVEQARSRTLWIKQLRASLL